VGVSDLGVLLPYLGDLAIPCGFPDFFREPPKHVITDIGPEHLGPNFLWAVR